MINAILSVLAFCLLSACNLNAQTSGSRDLVIRKLPDSILGKRTLILPDPFNATRALAAYFRVSGMT